MALAIRVNRMFRRRADTVDALHASLVPRRRPEIPGVEIAAMYLAATEDPEVGGDFYDVYQTPDGWGLAVGDVCGMGEEAAAVTAAARHAIRVLARRCADPGEVLAGTNEIVLAEELALDGGFVTANIAHLTWQDGQLRVVVGSAGHPAAAVLRSDGRVRMMGGGGLPLGLFPTRSPPRRNWPWTSGTCCSSIPTGWPRLAARTTPISPTGWPMNWPAWPACRPTSWWRRCAGP